MLQSLHFTRTQGSSRSRRSLVVIALIWAAAQAVPCMAQAPLPAGLSAPAKPTAMPHFDLQTTAGPVLHSDALRGQVVVIRFWASW